MLDGTRERAMSKDVTQPELVTVLSYLVGREIHPSEIFEALGVSRSSYYLARSQGRLISADSLLCLAEKFGLNPLDLLVEYGLLSTDAVVGFLESRGVEVVQARPSPRSKRLKIRTDLPPL